MATRYYVYAYDKECKGWICCQCDNFYEAAYVESKWLHMKDRNKVSIEVALRPRTKATMYKVTAEGTIVLKK